MSEASEGTPISPLVPPDGGTGSTEWSQFPREVFPVATALAGQIIADPNYTEAYDLFKRLNKAEDLLKMTRSQRVEFQNIPPKEEDPDIDNKRQAEVSVLHEELRTKSLSPEFEHTYNDVSSRVKEIVMLSLKGFDAKADEEGDPFTRGVFNNYAKELIDYNLDVLSGRK